MPSFQISVSPSRRAAGRFVTKVRRALQKAYAEEKGKSGLTQTAIAGAINVHRSVVNRELRGVKDITIGRVGELAWAMGRIPMFECAEVRVQVGSNISLSSPVTNFHGITILPPPNVNMPIPVNNNFAPILEAVAN